jgi:hypothetical protein
MVAAAATVITHYITPSLLPTPINTSTLTRIKWLRELLTGHSICFYNALGMPKHVFHKLVHILESHIGRDSKVQFSSVLQHVFEN